MNVNTNTIIAIVVIIIIVIGGLFLLQRESTDPVVEEAVDEEAGEVEETGGSTSAETPAPGAAGVEEMVVSSTPTVTYTNNGYSPSSVTINTGETVTFVNENSRDMWPATVIHPTHTVYPDSSIQKCGTSEADSIFDACTGITPGNSWSFTFDEVGDWRYHDHLQPSQTGTIVVQ